MSRKPLKTRETLRPAGAPGAGKGGRGMVGISGYLKARLDLLVPLGLFLLAFAVRYHFLATYNYPLMIHEQDGVAYMGFARGLLHWRMENYSLPPLYPALIAVFSALPVSFENAARLASITMDALTVLPLAYLAGRFLGPAGRIAVGVLWAFSPFSLYFTVSPLSQSSYLCCLLSGIALLYRGLEEEGSGAWLCAAGVFGAFAYLARIEGIIGVGCGALLCLVRFLDQGRSVRSHAARLCCYLGGFLAGAGPYLIGLHNKVGYWTVSVRGEQELKTPDAVNTLNAAGTLTRNLTKGLSLWTRNFGSLPDFLAFAGANAKAYLAVYLGMFPLWVHLLSLVGVALLATVKGVRRACYLLTLLLVLAPIFVLNIPKTPSYFYPVFPLLFLCILIGWEGILAAGGLLLGRLSGAGAAAWYRRGAGPLLLLPLLALVPMFYGVADSQFQDPGLVHQALLTQSIYQDAGEFLLHNSAPGDPVLTRWGLISYYADRPLMILPKGGVPEVVAFARKNGARFMVIDSPSVYSRRQELEELLKPLGGEDTGRAYGLQVVHTKADPQLGEGYVIYKVL